MGLTRLMWVGLNLCDELDWVEFFFFDPPLWVE